MGIQVWDPFHEMMRLRDAMNSLLQERSPKNKS